MESLRRARPYWATPGKLTLSTPAIGGDQLAEVQRIIDADNSDLFDVLAHVAYAAPTLTREERSALARPVIGARFTEKQQAFTDFVLSHYVREGAGELDQEKLTPLLPLRYRNSRVDAVAVLGKPDEIGRVFTGFQKFLYQVAA